MRREELYLLGLDQKGFRESDLIGSAVMQKLAVIGEAAARVSADLRSRHSEIPWSEIIAFRNTLVHAYFGIDWGVVWLAASKQVPVLRSQVAAIRQAEFDSPAA
jgi:uncharacterized protein with HEPN domain